MRVSRSTPLIERLASAIDYRGDDACWLWRAALDTIGYGSVTVNGRRQCVHRVVYELLVGPIPPGLELDHLCRVRACCNPRHLEPVTHLTNMGRGAHATKTHCKRGHPLTPENVYNPPSLPRSRYCVACRRLRKGVQKPWKTYQ